MKYRGIFLNDEAPSLTGWVKEKFGDYNHAFYTNVFELLLRLKANYLWPAMWNNAFNEDDPHNPKLADEYGIVMGTSHLEPMLRADKEWNRRGHTAADGTIRRIPTNCALSGTRASNAIRLLRKHYHHRNARGRSTRPMSETANICPRWNASWPTSAQSLPT